MRSSRGRGSWRLRWTRETRSWYWHLRRRGGLEVMKIANVAEKFRRLWMANGPSLLTKPASRPTKPESPKKRGISRPLKCSSLILESSWTTSSIAKISKRPKSKSWATASERNHKNGAYTWITKIRISGLWQNLRIWVELTAWTNLTLICLKIKLLEKECKYFSSCLYGPEGFKGSIGVQSVNS